MIDKLAKFIFLVIALFSAAWANAAKPFPSGPAQSELIEFQLAVYYMPTPTGDPLTALRSIVRRDWPALAVVKQPPAHPAGLQVSARMEMDVKTNYKPPDANSLGRFGHGLNKSQADAVQGSRQALTLDFSHPKKYTMAGLRTAYEVTEQVARATGGLLWDEETRELFTPDKWHELRLATWTGGVPLVSASTTIHAYNSGNFARAISLGMVKFGLPDIVVTQFPWSSTNNVGTIINLLAQALAEGAPVGAGGNFDLNLKTIANKELRERTVATLLPKAQSRARLALVNGTWEAGDPRNRLAEITFDRYAGPDMPARQDALLAEMFGHTDTIQNIKHNDELRAASQLAQKKLAAMQAEYLRGLRPGEYIQVKAPFERASGGNEWMWVEISAWKGAVLEGLLKNEPFDVPGLHDGQVVQVRLDKVFDYIRRYPDGTQEGNTTGKIIERLNNAKPR